MLRGAVRGIELFMQDKKLDYSLDQKTFQDRDLVVYSNGDVVIEDSLDNIFNSLTRTKEWFFLLTKSELYSREEGLGILGYFLTCSNKHFLGKSVCLISEPGVVAKKKALTHARSTVLTYHELGHYQGGNPHCEDTFCTYYGGDSYSLNTRAEYFLKNKKIPLCEKHKIA